jgi:hypothetical protein
MKKYVVNLDEETVYWLAAKIDDSKPDVRAVIHSMLVEKANAVRDVADARFCRCESIERISNEEYAPIVFDGQVNEYHLLCETRDGKAEYVMRYCFSCGGRAPISKRDQLFAKLAHTEVERLSNMCAGVRTFQNAIDIFGSPESDHNQGSTTIDKTKDGADEHIPHRVITYNNLSDTAVVQFIQQAGDLVSVSFIGKYLGPPKSADVLTQ